MEYRDIEVIQEAYKGQSEAFDYLVKKYWNWAANIAYGIINDYSVAQDVVQEAFLQAWQKLDQLAEPDKFKQWLRRIVINQAIMYLRRRKPTVSLENMEDPGIACYEKTQMDTAEQEDIKSVHKAMQNLGVRHRLLMTLFYIDGLSQRDIANLLEISESTVKSRLHDARAKIRKEISMKNRNEKQDNTIISLREISLRPLEEDSPWLEDINLDINAGELLVLTGPQNCGKYELLKVIGLLEKPDSGIVEINGEDTSKHDFLRFVETKVSMFGYIWRQPQLDQQMSGLENVVLPLISSGIKRDNCIERSIEVLRFVGLNDNKKDAPVRMLSALDQQKVALARALVGNPEVIIAQEPTGDMRLSDLNEFDQLLERTVRERNVTVVCSSHDLKMMKASDRMVWMDNGKMAKIGTFEEGPPKYVGRNACIYQYPASLMEALYYSGKYRDNKENLLSNALEKYQQAAKKITILKGKRESTDEELIQLQIDEFREASDLLNSVVSDLERLL